MFVPVQTMTWISNIMCRGLFSILNELIWDVIVNFVDIGDHCLSFILIILIKDDAIG